MKYGKWVWMWIAWGGVLSGIGWGQPPPEGAEENRWFSDPTPEELQAAADQIAQFAKKDSRYTQATLGETIPIYSGIGLWDPGILKRMPPSRGCLVPLREEGKVIALVTANRSRLLQRQLFRVWKEEALQQARALAAEKQAEVKRAYLVRLLFMKGWVRKPNGRIGTETKKPLFWDIPLIQEGKWVGAVRIDPYSGQRHVEEFPVPCPVGKTLSEEEVKKAAWGYFKQLGWAALYPDARLEELTSDRGEPPARHCAIFRSKVSVNKLEVRGGDGSHTTLHISPYGELVMYWLHDPYKSIEGATMGGVGPQSSERTDGALDPAGSAENPTVPRGQAWRWLGLLGLGALGLMVWRKRKAR